uniref:Uncharacterized protein n=1 Tax=Lygus hesperus TaxID=30085 RepID=A0A146KT19_LYGHE
MRCADAENKIWRLRIKCEEHCGCCHVHEETQDGDEEHFSDSNNQFLCPGSSLPAYKRHSLAVSKFNASDEGYGIFGGPAPSDRVPNHRPEPSVQSKPLVRSLSSGMIPKQRPRIKTLKGLTNDHQLTPESLSLSKVQWWQRDLFPQGRESNKELQQSIQPKSNWGKITSDDSDNNIQLDELSALVSNDAQMISRLVRQQNEEEYLEHFECSDESSRCSQHSAEEHSNRTDHCEDTCGSPLVSNRALLAHSSSQSDVHSLPSPYPTGQVQNRVQMNQNEKSYIHLSENLDIVPRVRRSLNNNNMKTHVVAEDAMAHKCQLNCCIPLKTETEAKCSSCSVNALNGNNVHQSQSNCGCRHPPSQIIIVPAGCCCRLMDNSSALYKESCCPYAGSPKCDQQCQVSFKPSPAAGLVDAPSAETLPLFVPKSKSTSLLSKELSPPISSYDDTHVISKQIPLQMANPCVENYCVCATPCSRGLTVPLAQRLDSNEKIKRKIEEGMNKLASNGRAETNSLTFKPWPPPHFAEMSPLLRCLAETSDYARQMAMAIEKVDRRVQKIYEMS